MPCIFFKALVTDVNGNYQPIQNAQQPFRGSGALQPPYTFFGLGRTNNYVEIFSAIIGAKFLMYKEWTPIIPNSQLIVSINPPN